MNDSSPRPSETYARTMAEIMTIEREIQDRYHRRPHKSLNQQEQADLRRRRKTLIKLARTLWTEGQNLSWRNRDGRELVLQDVSEPPPVEGTLVAQVQHTIEGISALREAIEKWLTRATKTSMTCCWFKSTSQANAHRNFLNKRLRTLQQRREELEAHQRKLKRAPINNDAWTEDLPEAPTDQHLIESCRALVQHVSDTDPDMTDELERLLATLNRRIKIKKPLDAFERENADPLTPTSPRVHGHYHTWQQLVTDVDPVAILRTHRVVPAYSEHTPIGRWCLSCGYTGIRSKMNDLCEKCRDNGVNPDLAERLYHSPRPTFTRGRWIEYLRHVCGVEVTIRDRTFILARLYAQTLPLLPTTLHYWHSDRRLIRLTSDGTEAQAKHAIVLSTNNHEDCVEARSFLEQHLPLH